MDPTGEPASVGARPGGEMERTAAARLLQEAFSGGRLGLTDLAARLLSNGAPVQVQVSLLSDVQTVTAGTNLPVGSVGSSGPLEDSLCTVTADSGGPLVISDARVDERVASLPPVTSGAVGSYVGVPLRAGPAVIGSLCAYTSEPREWSATDVALLEELSGAVVTQLELQALTGEFETSRLRWDLALDAAGVGSFAWELASGRLDWDDRMRTLFGYAPGEFPTHVDEAFARVHPDDRLALDDALERAFGVCGDFRAEYRVGLPDGSLRWLAARGRVVPGPDGAATRLLGTVHDVTAVRTARDEAVRLLETMTTGFVAIDRDWRVTYLNAEGAHLVRLTPAELVGRDLWEAFPGLDESDIGSHCRRAMSAGEPAQVEAYCAHLDGWFEVRITPSPSGLSVYFLEVTGRHADQQLAAAATARLELLATVSAELAAGGLDVGNAVARLARVVAPGLADWCLISLADDGDQVRDVGHWHSDPALRPVLDAYLQERLEDRTDLGAVHAARSSREPVVVESGVTQWVLPMLGTELARTSWLALGTGSIVVVPLLAGDSMTGVLTLCRGEGRPPMGPDDIATAREVAARAGLALDNARLYAEQRRLAEVLQRSLLTTPPEPDHCEIAVRYVPAARAASVGGDWYDAFLQSDGATVLVIGDVMGHDTAAAAAMGQLRGLLRGIAWHSGAPPAEVLSGLDAAMLGLAVSTTATAVVARLEQQGSELQRGRTRLRWSNAGHPPPMTVTPDGVVAVLDSDDADLLLGIDPRTARTEHVADLDRGSTVLLYTDGLIERRGQDLDRGTELLRGTLAELAHLPLGELCDTLLDRLLPPDADDDAALVAVRLHRQDRPRPAEAGPSDVGTSG